MAPASKIFDQVVQGGLPDTDKDRADDPVFGIGEHAAFDGIGDRHGRLQPFGAPQSGSERQVIVGFAGDLDLIEIEEVRSGARGR